MMLKFCDNNFLFYITHAKYFEILCYFVIFFLITLFILVKRNELIKKFKKCKFRIFFIALFYGIIVGFLIFLFSWLLNKDTFNGCFTKYYQNIYFKTENRLNETTDKLNNSKVIIVGDSRMEFIEDDDEIILPFNFNFVAKSGMKIDWFKNKAISKVKSILKNNNFNYYVVINMGVNDLNSEYKGDEISKKYFKLYSKLAEDYPYAEVYIMSVNPIYEKKLNKKEKSNERTTRKIKLFNKTIKDELKESNLKNLHYCDSYNTIHFDSEDGLHYTQNTNREIIHYIVNDCVVFK